MAAARSGSPSWRVRLDRLAAPLRRALTFSLELLTTLLSVPAQCVLPDPTEKAMLYQAVFDTVQNVDLSTGAGTGFAFTPYSPAALVAALRQAIRTYKDRDAWRRIQAAGMALDLSWENSARRYVEVYERATI